jgi:hypothetical protein
MGRDVSISRTMERQVFYRYSGVKYKRQCSNYSECKTRKIIILSHPDTQSDSQFYVYTIQPMGSEMMIHLQTKKSKKNIIAKGPEDQYLSFSMINLLPSI